VGEHMIDADEDARRRVGVVGGFAMDAMVVMICEICARSPGGTVPWDAGDGAGVAGRLGRGT
jgi:hypothetical protein